MLNRLALRETIYSNQPVELASLGLGEAGHMERETYVPLRRLRVRVLFRERTTTNPHERTNNQRAPAHRTPGPGSPPALRVPLARPVCRKDEVGEPATWNRAGANARDLGVALRYLSRYPYGDPFPSSLACDTGSF